MKKISLKTILLISIATLAVACVNQKFEKPTINCDSTYTTTHTIKQFKALFVDDTIKIKDDIIISGYVVSNDKEGNFYKELYLQDTSAGISIMLDDSYLYTRYREGQIVYVKCKGLYLGKDGGGVVKLGNIYTENGNIKFGRIQGRSFIDAHIIASCQNKPVEAQKIKITDINDNLLHQLVYIDSVQFVDEDISQTYADGINKNSMSRTITDKKGNKVVLYNSGYASFANDSLPKGNGKIYAVLGKYSGTYQLLIRSTKDVKFTNTRLEFFSPILKNFDDGDILSGGWMIKTIKGVSWKLGSYSSYKYVECNNYANPRPETESWYISPKLNLTNTDNPYLEFRNACKYSGDMLKVYYTTQQYDTLQNIVIENWIQQNPLLDNNTSSYVWTNSGKLYLPKETKHVAFRYTGTTSSGRHWEVDDIKIYDDAVK